MRYIAWVICFIAISIFSCKKETVPVTAPDSYDYMPVNPGHWVVYDVDSIVHADNDGDTDDKVDYYHFQIKEVISSTFIDGQNRPTQRIERYRRANPTEDWQIMNVVTSTVSADRVERVEDNARYIPLAFPINAKIMWNGNAFNQLGEQDYTYDAYHEPLELDNFSFDSTLTVLRSREEDDNFVQKIYSLERYAVHVGRIYKVEQNLGKTAGHVTSGLDYEETIVEYGD
jgi:hypothetical protein